MKKFIKFIATFSLLTTNAQKVGINTSYPMRTLDVEGNFRVKSLSDVSDNANYTNVMVQNPISGYIDAFPINKIVAAQPWQIEVGVSKPTLNTQNIYQNANIGIGDFSGRAIDGKLEILGSTGSQIVLGNLVNSTKWDLKNEGAGLSLSTKHPIFGNTRKVFFKNDGSVAFGVYISSTDNADLFAPNIGFMFNSEANTLKIGGNSSAATQALDVEGNVRIRALANSSSTVTFPRSIVAKSDGTLGYVEKSNYALNTYTAKVNGDVLITSVFVNNFYPIIIAFNNKTNPGKHFTWKWTATSGSNWKLDFLDESNSADEVELQVIWIPK